MQYKTYQEAKIANPESEIFTKKCEGVFKSIKKPETNHFIDGWQICKPKDYCISLESFLASGKRLVYGDLIIGPVGTILFVANAGVMNKPHDADRDTYVLKSKALENPVHEWANGDECVCLDYPGCTFAYIGKHPSRNGHYIYSEDDRISYYVSDKSLRKPESTEQKLERQRLESAYHLACIAGDVGRWGGEFTFEHFKLDENAVKYWLAIVDETNYLLYE